MTGYGFAASMGWAGVVVYAVWRADCYYTALLARHSHTTSTTARPVVPVTLNKVEVPDDLIAYANTESEPWAREDILLDVRHKYAETGDWQKVRRAVGIGELP